MRVSVDKSALEEFIKSARSDRSQVEAEFCVYDREFEASAAEFEAGVSALDDMTIPQVLLNKDKAQDLRDCLDVADYQKHMKYEVIEKPVVR